LNHIRSDSIWSKEGENKYCFFDKDFQGKLSSI